MTARPALSAMTDRTLVEVMRDLQQRRSAAIARHERQIKIHAESENELMGAAKDVQWFDTMLEWVAMEREARDA